MAARKGRQTPTFSFVLPYKSSLGSRAVGIYDKSGSKAQTWQKKLVKDIMATEKNGLWTHTKFSFAIPRRNGKTEVIIIRMLHSVETGEQVLYTAQLADTARSTWERMCFILDQLKIKYKPYRSAGREEILIEETNARFKFRTRTGRGGLGTGCDLLIIDEAQEYTREQESALKYTVTSSKNPQTLFCGTPPTLVSGGTVFPKMREQIVEGKARNSGWAEWSVEEMTDVWDKNAWYLTNPSLGSVSAEGIPFITERDITDEIGTDDEDFNIQRLGLWVKRNLKAAISEAIWNELALSGRAKLHDFAAGIDFGRDGLNACLSIAGRLPDGNIYVETIDKRPVSQGDSWILDFLYANKKNIIKTIVDGQSRQQLLADEMKELKLKAPLLPTVSEVINSFALFEDSVYKKTIRHNDQPALNEIVTNCGKRNIGTRGGFGYTALLEGDEIGILNSVVFAHYAACMAKKKKKQKIIC